MERLKTFIKKNYIIILSFFITLFLYIFISFINKIYPFGNETFLFSDLFEQYITYFNYLRDSILHGESLFNSFSFTLGQNYWGIITYFCISPLNILFLLSTTKTMPIFVLIIVSLKIALSSMSMSILLKNKKCKNLTILIFSIIYGLMSYNVVYATNIMWLDNVYLLPLIILGLEKLFDGKPVLYLVTLTLAICTNYYIAFAVCIFLVLYFIYYTILNKKEFKKNFLNFIKYSLLAVALSSVVLIPTIFNMIDGKLATASSDFSFNPIYNPIYLVYKFLIGDNKDVLDDYPHIASSLLVLLTVFVGLFSKNVTKREKILNVSMLTLLIIITIFPFFDTIMHCFRLPNHFTCRYAFTISFFMILVSAKTFDSSDVNKKNIFLYFFPVFIIFYFLKLCFDFRTISSSMFIAFYFICLIFFVDKKYLRFLVLILLMSELMINISEMYGGPNGNRTSISTYNEIYKYKNEINKLKPKQNEFYRINGLSKITLNDSIALGYYGITSFSPTISVNSGIFLKDYLGLPLKNLYSVEYNENTDFTKSLLGVKYEYSWIDGFSVQENKNVFPVLFKITNNNRFKASESILKNQNSLYKYLANVDDDLFKEDSNYKLENCSFESNIFHDGKTPVCNISSTDSREKYLEINSDRIFPLYSNREDITNIYGLNLVMKLPAKIYLIDAEVKPDRFNIYNIDLDKIEELSKILNQNALTIESHSNNKISGKISNNDDNQIMFTTIPYDDGWNVKINGEEVKTFKNLDSLLAFKLPKGELNIELVFVPKGFSLGLTISLLSFSFLLVVYIIKKNQKA